MKVSGFQFFVSRDVTRNYEAICRGIEQAAQVKADLLYLPEGGLSGYTHEFSQQEVAQAVEQLRAKAADRQVALALSTCYYEEDGKCYNQIRLYDRDGNYQGFHAKILRCGNPEDLSQGEKNVYSPAPLRTFTLDSVRFGCLICNDLWANPQWTGEPDPHLTRQLAQMGARLIVHAVNSGDLFNDYMKVVQQYHESNLAIRAAADNLYIATVNSCYGVNPCSASSGIVSPRGEYLVMAPGVGEQFFYADLPL